MFCRLSIVGVDQSLVAPEGFDDAVTGLYRLSARLAHEADLRASQARRCLETAALIDGRRRLLAGRSVPAVARHSEAVWRGRAATASRERLTDMVLRPLGSADRDLAAIVVALRRKADDHTDQELGLRRRSERVSAEVVALRARLDRAVSVASGQRP